MASAQIRYAQRFPHGNMRQRGGHQAFGVRAWDQDSVIDLERQRPEFAFAGDIGYGLAAEALLQVLIELPAYSIRQCLRAPRIDRGAVTTQCSGQ